MTKLSTTELRVMVGRALAKDLVTGKMNAVKLAVMVRVENAAKIEESLAALRTAEVAS